MKYVNSTKRAGIKEGIKIGRGKRNLVLCAYETLKKDLDFLATVADIKKNDVVGILARNKMYSTKLNDKKKITIPQEIQNFLNLHTGDKINFDMDKNKNIIIIPVTNVS